MNSTSYLADNWYWMVAASASGGLLMWQQLQSATVGGGLSPAQAVQLINREKGQVIDVCSAEEFAAAHVAGAKNVPLDQIAAGGKGLPSNKKLPLVVVCSTGARSAKAVAELKQLGYENAQSLGGGLKAWREANLPIDKA
jgi:rhodanese-related sulfurtransferase